LGVTTIITAVAIAFLVLHWRGPNAVWGGATLGTIVGIIVALVTKDWGRLLSFFALGTFIGTFFEWIGRIASKCYHEE
jgi:hypothetical protein